MRAAHSLAQRFREVILNGTWIANTNFQDQLSHTQWEQATKPYESLNSIAALTFHIHYYIKGVLQVLEGGPLEIRDQYSFDAPAIKSQQEWEALLDQLWLNSERFANRIAALTEEQLAAVFVKESYGSYQRNLEAMIEHAYYHLGQIVLIRKLGNLG